MTKERAMLLQTLGFFVLVSIALADYKLLVKLIEIDVPDGKVINKKGECGGTCDYLSKWKCELQVPFLCFEPFAGGAGAFGKCNSKNVYSMTGIRTDNENTLKFAAGSIGNWTNPSPLKFLGPWEGVRLKMKLEDWDGWNANDLVDTVVVSLNASAYPPRYAAYSVRHNNDRPPKCKPTIFKFNITITCAYHYAGNDCRKIPTTTTLKSTTLTSTTTRRPKPPPKKTTATSFTTPSTKAPTTTQEPTTKPPTTTPKPTKKQPTTTAKPTKKPPTTTPKPTKKQPTTTAKPTKKPPTTTPKPTKKQPTTTAKPTKKPPTTTPKPTKKQPTTTAKPTKNPPTATAKHTTTPSTKPTTSTPLSASTDTASTAASSTKPSTPTRKPTTPSKTTTGLLSTSSLEVSSSTRVTSTNKSSRSTKASTATSEGSSPTTTSTPASTLPSTADVVTSVPPTTASTGRASTIAPIASTPPTTELLATTTRTAAVTSATTTKATTSRVSTGPASSQTTSASTKTSVATTSTTTTTTTTESSSPPPSSRGSTEGPTSTVLTTATPTKATSRQTSEATSSSSPTSTSSWTPTETVKSSSAPSTTALSASSSAPFTSTPSITSAASTEKTTPSTSSSTTRPIAFGDCQVADLRLCQDWFKNGSRKSGLYNVSVHCGVVKNFLVYCDMDSGGGGWTLVQRRDADRAIPFDRDWASYVGGFGSPAGEHWLGLDLISAATRVSPSNLSKSFLRLDLWDCRKRRYHIVYQGFQVLNSSSNFVLRLGPVVEADVGDSLFGTKWEPWLSQNSSAFSTADADHDGSLYGNCAEERGGGFWFSGCGGANLNGRHKAECWYSGSDGVRWSALDSVSAGVQSLPRVEMKIMFKP